MIEDVLEGNKRFMLPQIVSQSYGRLFGVSDPYAWTVKKFATKLKYMVAMLTGCSVEDLEDQAFKARTIPDEWGALEGGGWKTPITYREFLQQLGTKVREINQRAWIHGLFSEYEHPLYTSYRYMLLGANQEQMEQIGETLYPSHSKWIITDMRYTDELEMVKRLNGLVIRISAGGTGHSRYVWTPEGMGEWPNEAANAHSSETALDHYKYWDYYIKNTGSLIELYNHAREIVTKFNLHI